MSNEILLNYGDHGSYSEIKIFSSTTANTYKDKKPRYGILKHL